MCFRPPTAKKAENKCPKCEAVNLPDAEVCINCGAELPKSPPPPGVSAAAAAAGAAVVTGAPPPPGAPGSVTPPKAPPAPPKAPPAPPKAPPMPPKKPGE